MPNIPDEETELSSSAKRLQLFWKAFLQGLGVVISTIFCLTLILVVLNGIRSASPENDFIAAHVGGIIIVAYIVFTLFGVVGLGAVVAATIDEWEEI